MARPRALRSEETLSEDPMRSSPVAAPLNEPRPSAAEAAPEEPRRMFLGKAVQRGIGERPRLGPEAAAAFATMVDTTRARAAIEGRTLVYTVRWG
jgi:hypothetical protein